MSIGGCNAVQIPDTELNGFGDRFGLSKSGVLASLDKVNATASNDLTIITGSVSGLGGSLIAEGGAATAVRCRQHKGSY